MLKEQANFEFQDYAKKHEPNPEPESSVAPPSPPPIPNIKIIPVNAIHIPPFLPTRELISHERLAEIRDSIKKHGQRVPIKVRRYNGDYELIDGYLRLKCMEQLNRPAILAEIEEASDSQVIIESIITNKNRIEEDPITVAKKLDVLMNAYGYSQEKLAEETGISQPMISKMISLLRLPKNIQKEIAAGNIGLRHALTLFTVNNVDLQQQLAKEIVEKGLTTRQLEERIQELLPIPTAIELPEEAVAEEAVAEAKPPTAKPLPKPTFQPEPEPVEKWVKIAKPEQECENCHTITDELKPWHEHMLCPTCFQTAQTLESQPEAKQAFLEALEKGKTAKKEHPEPLLTGFDVTCPECHKKLLINHIQYPDGSCTHEVEIK